MSHTIFATPFLFALRHATATALLLALAHCSFIQRIAIALLVACIVVMFMRYLALLVAPAYESNLGAGSLQSEN